MAYIQMVDFEGEERDVMWARVVRESDEGYVSDDDTTIIVDDDGVVVHDVGNMRDFEVIDVEDEVSRDLLDHLEDDQLILPLPAPFGLPVVNLGDAEQSPLIIDLVSDAEVSTDSEDESDDGESDEDGADEDVEDEDEAGEDVEDEESAEDTNTPDVNLELVDMELDDLIPSVLMGLVEDDHVMPPPRGVKRDASEALDYEDLPGQLYSGDVFAEIVRELFGSDPSMDSTLDTAPFEDEEDYEIPCLCKGAVSIFKRKRCGLANCPFKWP